jgi:putative heme iron utilization protein
MSEGSDRPLLRDPGFEARRLLRGASHCVLATQRDGQPFAALVAPAFTPGLSALLLLSSLSEHTRHLMLEPRCALIAIGEAEGPNPQTAPRATLTGLASPVPPEEAESLKARYLARRPYAAAYADFEDFALWRVSPGGGQYVGGFARAHRLRIGQIVPDAAAVAALAAAEDEILEHMNEDHPDAVAAIARAQGGQGTDGPWRMVALDPDGADLASGEEVLRLHFSAPAATPEAVRTELVAAARAARAGK